jgi:hypothetical protein
MPTQAQKSNIITQGRQSAKTAVNAVGQVAVFLNSYEAGGYSSLTDADFIGENQGILADDFLKWVEALIQIKAAWVAGQDTAAEKVTF